MSRSRALPLVLAAVLILAGCVDFVTPESLKLQTPVRLQTTLSVAASAGCGSLPGGGRANVCLTTTLNPGRDIYGRSRRLLDERLTALGQVLLPAEMRDDSTRVYRGAWYIAEAKLADSALVLVNPTIEGVALDPAVVRWYAVGRPGPDTLGVSTEGDFNLILNSPRDRLQPVPQSMSWVFDFYGPAAVFSIRGGAFPWSSYRLPESLLADLQATLIPAALRYNQVYFASAPEMTSYVQLEQTFNWTLRRPPAAPR
jgi:hypothetical protein